MMVEDSVHEAVDDILPLGDRQTLGSQGPMSWLGLSIFFLFVIFYAFCVNKSLEYRL